MSKPGWSPQRSALLVTGAYLVAGALWILLSDLLLASVVDPGRPIYAHLQTYKGWLFVAVTGMLLYTVLSRVLGQVHKSELARQRAAARYQQIVETAEEGVLLLDKQRRTLLANRKLAEMLGTTPQAMAHRPIGEFVDPTSLEEACAAAEGQTDRTFQHHELRLRRRDGSEMWVLIASSPVRDDLEQSDGVLCMVTDVTARKRAEAALENLVAGTAGVTGEAFFPIFARHLAAALDMKYVFVAAHEPGGDAVRILGAWTGDESVDDLAAFLRQPPCNLVLERGQSCHIELNIRRNYPDNALLRDLEAESGLGVPLFSADGQVIGAVIALHTAPLPDPERARGIFRIFAARAAAELGRQRALDQLKRLTETLDYRVVERTRELQELNDELNAFTFNVGHDLQLPLRGMRQFAQLLLQTHGEQLDDTGREYALRIVGSTARVQDMIKEMLDYSRLRHGDVPLEAVSSVLIVHESIGRLTRDPQLAQAVFNVHEPLPVVKANRLLLSQVVLNLLAACVRLVPEKTAPVVRIWATSSTGWAGLWFETNSGRIPADQRPRLFGLFEGATEAADFQGPDLGLALIRRSVERMGGTVSIEDAPTDGTRFCLELPLTHNGRSR